MEAFFVEFRLLILFYLPDPGVVVAILKSHHLASAFTTSFQIDVACWTTH